jgi:hypothetical protein
MGQWREINCFPPRDALCKKMPFNAAGINKALGAILIDNGISRGGASAGTARAGAPKPDDEPGARRAPSTHPKPTDARRPPPE